MRRWRRAVFYPMAKSCSVAGCDGKHYARGLCNKHRARAGRNGTTDPRPTRLCTMPGCGRKHQARGLCAYHWKQWRRWGNPAEPSHRAPAYSDEDLRRLNEHLDPVPHGKRAGHKEAGHKEVEHLALILGRPTRAVSVKLHKMRQERRAPRDKISRFVTRPRDKMSRGSIGPHVRFSYMGRMRRAAPH